MLKFVSNAHKPYFSDGRQMAHITLDDMTYINYTQINQTWTWRWNQPIISEGQHRTWDVYILIYIDVQVASVKIDCAWIINLL